MKKSTSRGMILAVTAGLALSSAAHAQFIIGSGTGTFTDISATGTVISFANPDDGTAVVTSTVTNPLVASPTLNVCTNGFICTPPQTPYTNSTLPMAGSTFGLFPFWDDLYVDGPGSVRYQAVVEGGINVFIVQWDHVRTYDGGAGTGTGTFEVKIFASGPNLAQFLYSDLTFIASHTNGVSATVGAQWSATNFAQFSSNTASLSNGTVLSITADTATGACCKNDGSCVAGLTGVNCVAQGGVWQGANSSCGTCPQPGACCLGGGACSFTVPVACTAQHGSFSGAGVTCAAANCPIQYVFDDGTAEDAYGLNVAGSMTFGNQFTSVAGADKITHIKIVFGCYATINGLPTTAYLWSDPNQDGNPSDATVIAHLDGVVSGAGPFPIVTPVTIDFDIPDTVVPVGQKFFVGFVLNNFPAANYPCAIDYSFVSNASWYAYDVGTASDPNIWNNIGELNSSGVPGCFMIRADATGSGSACYANCDASTTLPCLNVLDFGCFLNKFAAGDTNANCDASTTPPILNVLDFGCFLNKFASGCSGC